MHILRRVRFGVTCRRRLVPLVAAAVVLNWTFIFVLRPITRIAPDEVITGIPAGSRQDAVHSYTESVSEMEKQLVSSIPFYVKEATNLSHQLSLKSASETNFEELSQDFTDMIHQVRLLKQMIDLAEDLGELGIENESTQRLWNVSEKFAASIAPFLQHHNIVEPLRRAMFGHEPDSSGIVICVGNKNFKYVGHLIANIKQVLRSALPIQLVYAGDRDLSLQHRQFAAKLWPDVELVDVTKVYDDDTLQLHMGKYAIKPFAVLSSRFQNVILVEADVVFVQDPARLFDHPGYKATGAYLFHDRTVAWMPRFSDDWWQDQFVAIGHVSDNILQSRAMLEGWSDHAESGVVVLNKGAVAIATALLLTCWQNSQNIRQYVTYEVGHGDKESWWFALEVMGTPYVMEERYAAALGFKCPRKVTERRICTSNIAHLDFEGRLLWWNGGLTTDKDAENPDYAEVPTAWMVDGNWEGASPGVYSAMEGNEYHSVEPMEADILSRSIDTAKAHDENLRRLLAGTPHS